MQNRFNNNDFEHFVKHNADQYRMFPSDKVWKGIHNTLHTRRRWYGIGLALLLLTIGVVTWVMLTPSAKNSQVADTLPPLSLLQQTVVKEKVQPSKVAIAPARAGSNKTSFTISTDNLPENIFAASNTEAGTETMTEAPLVASTEIVTENPAPLAKVDASHYPESIARTNPAVRSIASNNFLARRIDLWQPYSR